ncbi:regulatory protein TetR (plasmid) [Asticcacaulis excentricus CB 48]|uniref:Regulatory protein TetR n=2 Tax=Asticcacaulis excentricus TaxID=78587 RepID=E8RVE2_ASTEC|nr:regulatory protein TetR [Asticcacaulis excentricus CB 48]
MTGRRGRPVNQDLHAKIVDVACALFSEFGFQATTMDKVAREAKISKLSIYRHFNSKEALFSAAITTRCQDLAPGYLFEGVKGTAEEQLQAVGNSLLRLLLSEDVKSMEAMIMSDTTNQLALSRLYYEAGPQRFVGQIEDLLRNLHDKQALSVPDPKQSARLFAALFKGADLHYIARFDPETAQRDDVISSYCQAAVGVFLAAHRSA